jgi:hypothetical protein
MEPSGQNAVVEARLDLLGGRTRCDGHHEVSRKLVGVREAVQKRRDWPSWPCLLSTHADLRGVAVRCARPLAKVSAPFGTELTAPRACRRSRRPLRRQQSARRRADELGQDTGRQVRGDVVGGQDAPPRDLPRANTRTRRRAFRQPPRALRRAAVGADIDRRLIGIDHDLRSGNFGLAVMTYEKLIGLLVEHPQLLNHCSTLSSMRCRCCATADAAAAWRCC